LFLHQGGGEVDAGAHILEPGLFAQPILKAAGMPAGEIGRIELVTELAEGSTDGGVGGAVVEHDVKAFTEFSGEACNFAVPTN